MNALLILLSAAAILTLYYRWSFNYWKKKGVETLKPNLLFGNLWNVIFGIIPTYRIFEEAYAKCKKCGGKFMGFYFLNKPALMIVDPELIKTVLLKDFSNFTDRPFYLDRKDPFTINILSAEGNQWKKMREQISPAFSPSKLKNVYHTLLQCGDQLKVLLDKYAENSEIVNLKDVSSKYTVDATGLSVLGAEFSTLQKSNTEFLDNAEKIVAGSLTQHVKYLLSKMCPAILHFFKIPFISNDIKKFYVNLIKTIVEYRENNNIVQKNLMQSLMQLKTNVNIGQETNFSSSDISDREKNLKMENVAAQAVILFGAAYEVISSTISLCIYELTANGDIQNNLREEILNVIGDQKMHISYESITKMTYLDKCVLETLRKYALVSMIARTCNEKYKLPNSDVVLDAGCMLYIPVYEIHHDPEYYPIPEKFIPERFSPENKSHRPSYTFLAFGEGHRNCIGFRLGLLAIKIFLITFLTNYNFSFNSKSELPPALNKRNLFVSLEEPFYLNVQKLSSDKSG